MKKILLSAFLLLQVFSFNHVKCFPGGGRHFNGYAQQAYSYPADDTETIIVVVETPNNNNNNYQRGAERGGGLGYAAQNGGFRHQNQQRSEQIILPVLEKLGLNLGGILQPRQSSNQNGITGLGTGLKNIINGLHGHQAPQQIYPNQPYYNPQRPSYSQNPQYPQYPQRPQNTQYPQNHQQPQYPQRPQNGQGNFQGAGMQSYPDTGTSGSQFTENLGQGNFESSQNNINVQPSQSNHAGNQFQGQENVETGQNNLAGQHNQGNQAVNQFQGEGYFESVQTSFGGQPSQGNQVVNQFQGGQPVSTNIGITEPTNLPLIQLPVPVATTFPAITDEELDKLFGPSPTDTTAAVTSVPILSNNDSGSLANLQIIGAPSNSGPTKGYLTLAPGTNNQSPKTSTSENGEPIFDIDIRGNFIKKK